MQNSCYFHPKSTEKSCDSRSSTLVSLSDINISLTVLYGKKYPLGSGFIVYKFCLVMPLNVLNILSIMSIKMILWVVVYFSYVGQKFKSNYMVSWKQQLSKYGVGGSVKTIYFCGWRGRKNAVPPPSQCFIFSGIALKCFS